MVDAAFEKGGGALAHTFQINGFWPQFYIKKSLNCGKKGGGRTGRYNYAMSLGPRGMHLGLK